MASVGSVKATVAAPFRRRSPAVLWADESVGLGNLLYLWLQAYSRRRQGHDTTVLRTRKTVEWAEWFPSAVSEFTVPRADVSFFNPRIVGTMYQRFGEDFTLDDLETFIDDVVLAGESPFGSLVARTVPIADLAINVRRGDYYSSPKYRGWYSFDVVEYVRSTLLRVRSASPISKVLVVSDDLEWCRLKLARLTDEIDVVYPEPGTHPAHQLALLAASPRLILTNSTFSYWAGYLSNRVHAAHSPASNCAQVWAPWFHSRAWDGGAADQLDPRWSIVKTIPGGWDG